MSTGNTVKADGKEAARKRLARFRAKRKRFDYAPNEQALALLALVAKRNDGCSWSEILDAIVIKAVAGNGWQ